MLAFQQQQKLTAQKFISAHKRFTLKPQEIDEKRFGIRTRRGKRWKTFKDYVIALPTIKS